MATDSPMSRDSEYIYEKGKETGQGCLWLPRTARKPLTEAESKAASQTSELSPLPLWPWGKMLKDVP